MSGSIKSGGDETGRQVIEILISCFSSPYCINWFTWNTSAVSPLDTVSADLLQTHQLFLLSLLYQLIYLKYILRYSYYQTLWPILIKFEIFRYLYKS